jgi:hypothetical protein
MWSAQLNSGLHESVIESSGFQCGEAIGSQCDTLTSKKRPSYCAIAPCCE